MDLDDDDPIEEEYDVILHTESTKDLCLFQFPLRPKARPLQTTTSEANEPGSLRNLRMKPIHYKMEGDYLINKFTQNYNEDFERNLELNIKEAVWMCSIVF